MEILKTLLPNLKTVGILVNPKHISYNEIFEVHNETAKKLGISIRWYEITKKEDITPVIEKVVKDHPDAFMTTAEALISGNPDLITPVLRKAKIPSIDFNVERGVVAGYLMVHGVARYDTGRRGAIVIYKVLQGEDPGNIPIEFSSSPSLEINAALAKEMGIIVPDALLFQANKIY
jgi:putative ABC transport system substrate-binding protein